MIVKKPMNQEQISRMRSKGGRTSAKKVECRIGFVRMVEKAADDTRTGKAKKP